MTTKSNGLNTRQWDLYNYLKKRFADGLYITTEEITQAFPQYYTLSGGSGSKCRLLVADVKAINDCPIIQKLIISSRAENKNGYKIGTADEVDEFLKRNWDAKMKGLKRALDLRKKFVKNGQYKLTFDSNERDVIEAFIR